MKVQCYICKKTPLTKDEVGINKKLRGTNIKQFMCLNCLADYYECTVSDIEDKIKEFKNEGCKLFE